MLSGIVRLKGKLFSPNTCKTNYWHFTHMLLWIINCLLGDMFHLPSKIVSFLRARISSRIQTKCQGWKEPQSLNIRDEKIGVKILIIGSSLVV